MARRRRRCLAIHGVLARARLVRSSARVHARDFQHSFVHGRCHRSGRGRGPGDPRSRMVAAAGRDDAVTMARYCIEFRGRRWWWPAISRVVGICRALAEWRFIDGTLEEAGLQLPTGVLECSERREQAPGHYLVSPLDRSLAPGGRLSLRPRSWACARPRRARPSCSRPRGVRARLGSLSGADRARRRVVTAGQ